MRPSQGHGVIVLAAYRPDPELFAVQLRSIRDQTRPDFRCLIGADGGQAEVLALVAEVVGGDDRFEVVGWDDNLGFYLNFERLLRMVPDDVAWVALSDQDDRWYPDKLARLVPLLDDAVLATGQARVVTWPQGEVALERTDREVAPADDLLFQNQVTGAFTVLRRELLDVALPFPRLLTVTQIHDHWLAMCAVAVDRYVVLDEVVQDYVQHGGNQVGEVSAKRARHPMALLGRLRELADAYVGGHGIGDCLSTAGTLSYGWRRELVRTLDERAPGSLPDTGPTDAVRRGARLGVLLHVIRSPRVVPGVAATFVLGSLDRRLGDDSGVRR